MDAMILAIGYILGTSFMYATPLIFTANGAVITENSGVVNIGLEGMMTIGAFAGAAAGVLTGDPWLSFFIAGLSGAFFGLLHAIACVKYNADQVVSGIAINFLAPGVAFFLSRRMFDGATMTPSVEHKMPKPFNDFFTTLLQNNPDNVWARFSDNVFNQNITVFMGIALVFVTWYVMNKTRLGLRIRAVGEHPKAADTVGVNIYRIRYFCVIMSGFFAGLGGAAMSIAIVAGFRPGLISGHGFIAMAAMIFGKWKPRLTMVACLLFGATNGLKFYLGSIGVQINGDLLSTMPYVITLLVLVFFVGKAVAPAASGKPYEVDAR